MINKNITIIIALISTTCIQQIDAHKNRKKKAVPVQRVSPYEERKDELTKIINKKTGQWYNTEIREPLCGYTCTRTDWNEVMAASYTLIPCCMGALMSTVIQNPIPSLIGGAASCLCLETCSNLYNSNRIPRKNDQILGKWYNTQICHNNCTENPVCTRVDLQIAIAAGYACTPACAGATMSIATSSLTPFLAGTAATYLCIEGCLYWNDPDEIACKEKSERELLPYVFTH